MTVFALAALALVWAAVVWTVALIVGALIAHGQDGEPTPPPRREFERSCYAADFAKWEIECDATHPSNNVYDQEKDQ